MSSASIWVKRDERDRWRFVATIAALAMLAAGLITALPLAAQAQLAGPSFGDVDPETPGVYLYNAGADTQGFLTPPPAACAGLDSTDPTNTTVQLAVDAGILYFIGDEPSEVISNNLGADLERQGGLPDTTIADVNIGLRAPDDYGLVENGGGGSSDDNENYDAQTGGDITLQLDVDGDFDNNGGTDIRYIVPDGVTSVGQLNDIPGQEFTNLDGAEIFIFEDAETSGMTIELFGPGGAGPYLIDIVDYQRNPDTIAAADDTLIAIDLDTLPGFTFPYVEFIRITDDGAAQSPNVSTCPGGSLIDTSLELDAVATRTDTVVANPAIDIEKATNGIDADTPTGPTVAAGSTVNWTYVVTNTGEAPLVNVTVVDDQGVTLDCDATGGAVVAGPLAPGGTFTCTGSGLAAAGQYMNNSTVVGTPTTPAGTPLTFTVTDEDPSHYIGVSPGLDIEKATNGADSDVAPGNEIPFEGAVEWTYVVTNNGTTSLINFTVADDQGVAVNCDNTGGPTVAGPIAPGGTFTCVGTGTAVLGQYTNNSTVEATAIDDAGNPLPGGPLTAEDPSNYVGVINPAIDIEKATNGQDADTPTGPSVAVGETVTWTYVVTNIGTTNLVNATVTDSVLPDAAIDCETTGTNVIPGTLAPGDVATCTASGPATLGQYQNDGLVGADPADAAGVAIPGVPPVNATDPSHYIGTADAAVDIEKATNGEDADVVTGPELVVGEAVTWTYVVTNTGTTALIDLTVTDDQGVAVSCDGGGATVAGPIAPGGSFTCTGTGTAAAGQYTNNSDVVGTPATAAGVAIPGLANVVDEDPSNYIGLVPSIDLEKATNDEDADVATGPVIAVGDAVTWTYTVTNDGPVTLTDVAVTDSLVAAADINCGAGTNVIPTMAPGDIVNCFASGTATFGQYMNTGTAEGQPVNAAGTPVGGPINDTDPSHYIGAAEPAVSIEKSTNGEDADTITGPGLVVGETVTWTYVVTNTGTTNLVDLTVTDDVIATLDCDGTGGATVAGPVAPAGSFTCTATGLATAGQYVNNSDVVGTPATADGTPIAGLANVVDEDPSHYIGLTPSIEIEKATNGQDADTPVGPIVAVGDPVTWTYVVTNTGETTLTGVTVTDNLVAAADISCAGGTNVIATMAPGAVVSCEASGIAELGQYANESDVAGQPVNAAGDPVGAPVVDDDPSHYFGTGVPAVDIEKATNTEDADAAPGPTIADGAAVEWTYVVTNTGTVPLVNFRVVDDQGVAVDCGGGSAVVAGPIAPGADFTCTGTGTATAGQYTNNSTVIADPVDGDGNPLVDPSGNPVASPTDEDPSNYFGADPSISLIKRVNGNNANTAPGVAVPTGSTVNWGFLVTNDGNVDLTAVTLNDPLVAGIDCGDGTPVIALLAPGESVLCNASGTAVAGQVTNVADVTGTPVGPDGTPLPAVIDDDPANYFGGDSAIDIEKDTNGIDADTGTGPVLAPGAAVTWTYVVTNTGTSILDNVTVVDDIVAAADIDCGAGSNVVGTLNPGDSATCTATGVATAGQYNNIGSVIGDPANGDDPVTDEDPSAYLGAVPSIDIEKATNGEDADVVTGPILAVGETVNWTYVVTNTGNVDLGAVTVTDDQGVVVDCGGGSATLAAPLAPGASVTCTGTGSAVPGQYTNMSDVTGDPVDPAGAPLLDAAGAPLAPVTDDDPSNYFGADPSITLEKATNGIDADAPTGPVLGLGDAVTWTYVVTNTGNVDLTNVTVTDDQGVTIDCGGATNVIASMAPAAVVTCTGTGDAALGQYANLGEVTGDPTGPDGTVIGGPVTADDPSHYFGLADPNIELTKFVEGADANTTPGTSLVTGEAVTWTYVVTNTGNVDLAAVTVTDDQGEVVDCGGGSNVIALLAVGDTVTCTATGTVVAGQYTNLGEVTGDPVDENGDPVVDETGAPVAPVTDDDPANYFGGDSAIDVEKATNGEDADVVTGPSVLVGDAITWTYVVTNTGNLDLTDVSVTDDQGVTVVCPGGNPIPALAIGDAVTCEGTGIAVDGQYENTATATGTDSNGGTVTDADPSHYIAVDPSVLLEKATNGIDADTPTGPSIAVGDPVTWTYVVTNDGTADLTAVTVTDDIVAAADIDCGDGTNVVATLAVGDSATCTAEGVATAGQYANLGSVSAQPVDGAGDPIGPVLTDDDPSHYFGGEPGLTLEKATNGVDADTTPGPVIAIGDPVTWTYVVTNTGNVSLASVTVTDDVVAATDIDCGDGTNVVATLAAGDSATCTATGVATAGQYENTGSVSALDPDGNTQEATDPSHYFGAAPAIDLEKSTNGTDADAAPGPSIQVGDTVTWTYLVINTGNVELQNVTVTDDLVAAADIDCGDGTNVVASLAPSATATCTATGVATDGGYTNMGSVSGDPVLPNGDPVPGGPVTSEDPSNYTGTPEPLGNIGDTVWIDLNADGVVDADEVGIPGVTITLTDSSGNVVGTQDTDASGNYLFTGLPADTYTVTVDTADLPAGYTQTYDNDGTLDHTSTVALAAGATDLDQDFGYVPAPSIDLEKATNGFDGDTAPGITIPAGDPVTWTYAVTNDGAVVVTNIVVTDDQVDASAIDCGDGTNTIASLAPGDTVECSATGIAIEGAYTNNASATGEGPTGAVVTDEDPSNYTGTTEPLGSIGDTVWLDENRDGNQQASEVGLAGVTMKLIDSDGNTVATEVTDSDGKYLFTDVPAGSYTVMVDKTLGGIPAGAVRTYDNDGTLDNVSTLTLPAGGQDLDQDFGYALADGVIGDTVWLDLNSDGVIDSDEVGVAGIEVILTDSDGNQTTAVTDADGKYLFDGLPAGSYTVTVSKANTVIGPNNAFQTYDDDGTLDNTSTVNLPAGGQDLDQDFGYVPSASIGNYIFEDNNANGVQDDGEGGVSGAVVNLYTVDENNVASTTPIATVTTDSDGEYQFTNLDPRLNYAVQVVVPDGAVITTQDAGTDDGIDSDIDPNTGFTTVITLAPGDNDFSFDAGIVPVQAGVTVNKVTNGDDADTGQGQNILEGAVITWTYTVTNTGGTVLVDVAVVDDKEGAATCPKTTLEPGESMDCTIEGVATPGFYVNNGTVTGTPAAPDGTPIPGLAPVTDDDPSAYTGVEVINVTITPVPTAPPTATAVPQPTTVVVVVQPTPIPTANPKSIAILFTPQSVGEVPAAPPLALTGRNSTDFALVAVALMLSGAAFVALSRRREDGVQA